MVQICKQETTTQQKAFAKAAALAFTDVKAAALAFTGATDNVKSSNTNLFPSLYKCSGYTSFLGRLK